MLAIKPVPEASASDDTRSLYHSVKKILGTSSVPLLFQYLAVFPKYFSYIWQQLLANIDDEGFQKEIRAVEEFALTAVDTLYTPNAATKIFINKIEGRIEQLNLLQFTQSTRKTNTTLYVLSLAIRESVKGMYLGTKKIEQKLSPHERMAFEDLSEGFFEQGEKSAPLTPNKSSSSLAPPSQQGLAIAPYQEFFKLMQWEMDALVKKETYLFKRVELERFALTKLDRLPHPLNSTFGQVARFAADSEHFTELLYILAELFPTQAPYRLLASAVMTKALVYRTTQAPTNDSIPIFLPPKNKFES